MTSSTDPHETPLARTLTEEDVNAIVKEVLRQGEPALQHWFYINLGRGLWRAFWKILLIGIIGVAAYGASGGHKIWE